MLDVAIERINIECPEYPDRCFIEFRFVLSPVHRHVPGYAREQLIIGKILSGTNSASEAECKVVILDQRVRTLQEPFGFEYLGFWKELRRV
jgi:hypothetical protein